MGVRVVTYISLASVGILLASLTRFCQTYIKAIVAYSRIRHISRCLLAMLGISLSRANTVVLISLSHGLASAFLFYLCGEMRHAIYSRSTTFIRGFAIKPLLVVLCLLICFINIGFPLFLRVFGELEYITRSLVQNSFLLIYLLLQIFLVGFFSSLIFHTLAGSKSKVGLWKSVETVLKLCFVSLCRLF